MITGVNLSSEGNGYCRRPTVTLTDGRNVTIKENIHYYKEYFYTSNKDEKVEIIKTRSTSF